MISFREYCMCVSILFMFTGMGLFFYCVVSGISVWECNHYSSPVFYIVFGLIFVVAAIVKKYEHLIKGEVLK